MKNFKIFAFLVLAVATVSTLSAETRCPANVASITFRLINDHQMIVPVSINHAGPYNFLLDTGTQITMVDPSLASELHLATEGQARVASVGTQASASFARLDRLEAGTHAVANQKVLVYDLANLDATGLHIQGVLGEDFLEKFDMLIDNAHRLLCLDDSTAMRADVKGPHIPLLAPAQTPDGAPLSTSLIVSVRLSDGMRPVRLKLDSGANVCFLYNTSEYMDLDLFHGASLNGGGANSQHRTYTALPPQSVNISSVQLSKVPFVTLAGARKDSRTSDFDGLLTLGLFRRIFIDHADHFAVLESR
jgi:hypothetical protein